MNSLVRIEKYLSDQGICSRREAKKFIEEGLVFLNKVKVQAGDKLDPKKDLLELDSKVQKAQEEKISVLVYKPRGVLSSKDEGVGKTIFDVFPQFKHLNTIGRLDKESDGLIILSNDGILTKAITGKDHLIEKEYIVKVRENVTPSMMTKMSQGMKLEDGWTLPAQARKIGDHSFSITLKEGRKHQIRRMSNACKLTVNALTRIRIHTIQAPQMLPGNFKKLTKEQVQDIKNILK
jgi:23S rRNA pseudouridine2604 synthase